MITVEPSSSLMDDPLMIRINGLTPGVEITLAAEAEENVASFMSSACFISDSHGQVDVSKLPSVQGTYTGIDSMGLLWSMVERPGQKPGMRLVKKDITKPIVYTLRVHSGHLTLSECCGQTARALAATTCQRFYKHPDVKRIEVNDGRLRGALFVPAGRGPFPGVVDLFGGIGGLVEHRAALLASRGIAALALAYFRYKDLPETFFKLDLEYFEEAVNWLSSQSVIARNQIGLCGICIGANISLLLSTLMPQIRACATINAGYFNALTDLHYKGRVLKADKEGYNVERIIQREDEFTMKNCGGVPGEASIFQIEKSNAQFLFLQGEDDQSVDSICLGKLESRMKAHGRSNYQAVMYPEAGHLIEPPYTPFCYRSPTPSLGSGLAIWGGSLRPHVRAQKDAWRRILEFFRTHLPRAKCAL